MIRLFAACFLLFGVFLSTGRAHAAAEDDFAPCGDAAADASLAGSLCARFKAPLDRAHPGAERVELFLRRFPAQSPSRGRVWLIAGGPGESGATLYPLLATLRQAFPGFDLIVPDRRGTGSSTPLCPAGMPAERCAERAASFSTTDAAYDLQAEMNRYGGAGTTLVYGASYGSQLVLRTLRLVEPGKIDAVILDSPVHPGDASRASFIVDQIGRKLLESCNADPKCRKAVGGDAVAALARLERDPAVAQAIGGDPRVFFGDLLDYPRLRAEIPAVIAGLSNGDHAALDRVKRELAAETVRRQPASPLARIVIGSENDARPGMTRQQVEQEQQGALFISPLPGELTDQVYPRYIPEQELGQLPVSAPRILILQGDMDARAAYEETERHSELLDSKPPVTYYRIEGAPHFLMLAVPECVTSVVTDFVNGEQLRGAPCSTGLALPF